MSPQHRPAPSDPAPAGEDRGLAPVQALARRVTAALQAAGHSVATAESLTAGRLAAALADAPGAGEVFLGGVVAYTAAVKSELLHVDEDLLADQGAVHPEVAAQMAEGVRALTHATYGLATTGAAGPAPHDGRPVGTVHIAAAGPLATRTAQPRPPTTSPEDIRAATVEAALRLLQDLLRPPP
ncbi:CinA family protein [Streptomyces sp. TLI_171]|uniref:CinA family protein n=1 Tax=Streptomyces sp. TLI_171 TaxID=1938859 RepID=UPI000C19F86A|nr:CinA family protein [Streptomyces sp. TLI_171]RKE17340.1 nicotinamide-nucleotide amidase [Streptomyces sp. TLI_171]